MNSLSELTRLEKLDTYLFRGTNLNLGSGRIFGGQLMAQALYAAGQICTAWPSHSLHAYFLRSGDMDQPVEYAVEILNQTRSFANLRVVATQQNRAIFHLAASFQAPENGIEHQAGVPLVIPPTELKVLSEASAVKQRTTEEMRIEIRPTSLRTSDSKKTFAFEKYRWIKIIDELPDTQIAHQCALLYATDFGLIETAREVHGIGFRDKRFFTASLDHSIWFHRHFRCDDWMLYAMNSTIAVAGRGFVQGQIFDQSGGLIASVTQEGLIRSRSK